MLLVGVVEGVYIEVCMKGNQSVRREIYVLTN